jgi:hypothetical protein
MLSEFGVLSVVETIKERKEKGLYICLLSMRQVIIKHVMCSPHPLGLGFRPGAL